MNTLRLFTFLSLICIGSTLNAQTTDLTAVSDLFEKFPPTLTAKEALEKWETLYKSKCVTESEYRIACKTKKTGNSSLTEIALYVNPQERSIDMVSLQLSDGPLAKMNPTEIINKLPLEKEKPKAIKIKGIPGKFPDRTDYSARTLLSWYDISHKKEGLIQSISRIHTRDGLGYAPKYEIRCIGKEFEGSHKDYEVKSECLGDSTITLIIHFEEEKALKAIDFNYQYLKIIEALEKIAPGTKHPDVWLKVISVFKEITNHGKNKPDWFNAKYRQHQSFPFGSYSVRTEHFEAKHRIEAFWTEPMLEPSH